MIFTRIKKLPACKFRYAGPADALANRQILGKRISQFHWEELEAVRFVARSKAEWHVFIGDRLLFDRTALEVLEKKLEDYRGSADRIRFLLRVDDSAFQQYYSLSCAGASSFIEAINMPPPSVHLVDLPLTAQRTSGEGKVADTIIIDLPLQCYWMATPGGLCEPFMMALPMMLLLPYSGEFDLLFANQIAFMAELFRRIRKSPRALTGLLGRRAVPWRQRISAAYRQIHRTARVHPTAVVEGSIIGPNVRIGAHCVVRYSKICADAVLHDGAKVELSVIGEKTWLMHDLVLYRSYTEDNVFLTHGPYQFSAFQSKTEAFAALMMDHRHDGRPIRVSDGGVAAAYSGRFLGAVLREGAKALGGCLLAPGTIVGADARVLPEPLSKQPAYLNTRPFGGAGAAASGDVDEDPAVNITG